MPPVKCFTFPEAIANAEMDAPMFVSRVEDFITKKNVLFWDIKTQFVLHRRQITSPLQNPAS
jgi:hypothetical protein